MQRRPDRECRGNRAAGLAKHGEAQYHPAIASGRSSGVEHNLAKVGVEGSNPFARSSFPTTPIYYDTSFPNTAGTAW